MLASFIITERFACNLPLNLLRTVQGVRVLMYVLSTPFRMVLSRLSKFAIQSCHEFEVKKVKEKERARRREVNQVSQQLVLSE